MFLDIYFKKSVCCFPGNCAIMKPSELAENTAKVMEELIPKYLDQVMTVSQHEKLVCLYVGVKTKSFSKALMVTLK
jgi:hypothetical protein